MKRASPTHGGRWLAQTNYDALMTHHTTENSHPSFISYVMSIIYILRKKYHIHRSQNLSSSAVRADALALHGARTSAGTVMTTNPYPDGVYTPAWSVHSKATLLPLPLECTLQPHSEYHRCTLGCHSMDLVKSLTNRNTLQRHFKCTPDGVYTPLPLL